MIVLNILNVKAILSYLYICCYNLFFGMIFDNVFFFSSPDMLLLKLCFRKIIYTKLISFLSLVTYGKPKDFGQRTENVEIVVK